MNLIKMIRPSVILMKSVHGRLVRSLHSSTTLRQLVRVSDSENGVRRIVLANKKTRNALSLSMLGELKEALDSSESVDGLRCIVLSAEGKVFSAGHNLKELVESTGREHHTKIFELCARVMQTLPQLDVPVIAQVNGVAAAAGCQLVAACDIVVASDNSSFMTPGANFGIFCSTPGIPLVRNVPRKVSADMLLTGLPISALRALQCGLVSDVVPAHELDAAVEKRIAAILGKSRSVIALGKRFMYKQMRMSEELAYSEGSEVMVSNINKIDGQEGINSFIGKKKPVWTHSDE